MARALTTEGYDAERYHPVLQALHWITALLMFAIVPIAWVMLAMPRAEPLRPTLFMLHKSIGVTIFALVAARIVWRGLHPAPALPWSLEPWEAAVAKISHVLLYFILIAMPVSGFILSSAANHPVSFFGLFTLPGLTENKALADAAEKAHLAGQWAVYVLVGAHVLATVWHIVVKRDGLLGRMLPRQINAE